MSGQVVQALPDRPLRPNDLRSLHEHGEMEILGAQGTMPNPVARGLLIQTESWYYALGYEGDRGWFVLERQSRSSSDGRDMARAAFDEWVDDDDPVKTDRPF